MSISIIGGRAKGHALLVPNGDQTKPTSVMLRRKFFDSKQDCSDFVFVDLFAGTGAMGLEAFSRGCDEVYFCEKSKQTFRILEKNVDSLRNKYPDADFKVFQNDACAFLERFLTVYKNFDDDKKNDTIIYIDPPYENKKVYLEIFDKLLKVNFSGEIWVESDRQKGYQISDFEQMGHQVTKEFWQGTSYIVLVVLK